MHSSPTKRKKPFLDTASERGVSPKKPRTLVRRRRPRSLSIDSLPDSEDDLSDGARSSVHETAATISSWTPRSSRRRSFSLDSVSESPCASSSHTPRSIDVRQVMEGVIITPASSSFAAVYHPFRDEIEEVRDLHVPGEVKSCRRGLPVRFLDSFTFYDEDRTYLPFALVAARMILPGSDRRIRASGKVSRCLEDFEDGDSDIADIEAEVLVSLQPLQDFWTDYNADQPNDVWRHAVGVATTNAWYILQQPAALYTTFYQPFWIAHHLTWKVFQAIRENRDVRFKDFCFQLEHGKDTEAVSIIGRGLVERDLTEDYVVLYILDQLSDVKCSKTLLKAPLVECLADRTSLTGLRMKQVSNLEDHVASDVEDTNKTDAEACRTNPCTQTVTMPLVHELTTGLFLKTLLKSGKVLDSRDSQHRLLQIPESPDILHPDRPTNVECNRPIDGSPGYFREVCLDGEAYSVGDIVMVNPGEDDLIHRAKSALEACSQSRENALVNRVWFCQIIYMFDERRSHRIDQTEPTAHVQWYEHGSKTILQETAHPYGVFALAECADIPVGSILGRCTVRHLQPGDEEPHDYHCSFVWDSNEARFLDQSIVKQEHNFDGCPHCPCCTFNEERNEDTTREILIHSETHAEVRGVKYHKYDFVYVAVKADHPYLIGQIRRFVIEHKPSLHKSQVELILLGRFDDIARTVGGPFVKQDETRLFITGQVNRYNLSLLEGKCFIREKDIVTSQDLADHFYVDRWAARIDIRGLEDLTPFQGQTLAVCKSCVRTVEQEQQNVRIYKACNAPLKAMELFAGAGGLSAGLEQSGFVKTCWAMEILPDIAATFQANHPDTIVYNQDTNVCLQNAIDVRDGKPCSPLTGISGGKPLPPMPQRGDVDLITGGFPCQSFSGANHQRHKRHDDIRITLVANMLSYVEFYQPRYVLMENVKGLLQHHSRGTTSEADDEVDDGHNVVKMSIVKFVLRALLRLGYQTQFKILQAADYGSPQRRERVIFWGARRPHPLPEFPLPTHVAPRHRSHVFSLPTHDKLSPAQRSDKNCAPFRALVVADAISDLPGFDWKNPHVVYSEDEAEADERRRRRQRYQQFSAVSTPLRPLTGFLGPVAYACSPMTRYQRMLRGDKEDVTLHCTRTFGAPIVERVWHACSHHVTGPHDLPRGLWTRALLKASKNDSKLDEKWQKQFSRLKWKEPFYTALTRCRPSFAKGGKILHPRQKRIITARECARSQGFPDSYEFVQTDGGGEPTAWGKLFDDIHKQIGNAVPVPLAHALGKSLGKALVAQWLKERGYSS